MPVIAKYEDVFGTDSDQGKPGKIASAYEAFGIGEPSETPQTLQKSLGQFDTPLSPDEESRFRTWKQKYAPRDSGADYDLRGAFKAGITPDPKSGHWPDTFKKPNHPTFSIESKYAAQVPSKAGSWNGNNFIPPQPGQTADQVAMMRQQQWLAQQSPERQAQLTRQPTYAELSGLGGVPSDARAALTEFAQEAVAPVMLGPKIAAAATRGVYKARGKEAPEWAQTLLEDASNAYAPPQSAGGAALRTGAKIAGFGASIATGLAALKGGNAVIGKGVGGTLSPGFQAAEMAAQAAKQTLARRGFSKAVQEAAATAAGISAYTAASQVPNATILGGEQTAMEGVRHGALALPEMVAEGVAGPFRAANTLAEKGWTTQGVEQAGQQLMPTAGLGMLGAIHQLAKPSKKLLLTPDGAARWAKENPAKAAKIAEKSEPTRRDMRGVVSAFDRMDATERAKFSALVKRAIERPITEVPGVPAAVDEIPPQTAEQQQAPVSLGQPDAAQQAVIARNPEAFKEPVQESKTSTPSGLSEQQRAFIEKRVQSLGSLEAVNNAYQFGTPVGDYAREVAGQMFRGATQEAKPSAPESPLPSGIKYKVFKMPNYGGYGLYVDIPGVPREARHFDTLEEARSAKETVAREAIASHQRTLEINGETPLGSTNSPSVSPDQQTASRASNRSHSTSIGDEASRVNPEVLADYPDLKPATAAPAEQAATPPTEGAIRGKEKGQEEGLLRQPPPGAETAADVQAAPGSAKQPPFLTPGEPERIQAKADVAETKREATTLKAGSGIPLPWSIDARADAIPGSVKVPDAAVEARMAKARGLEPQSFVDRVKEMADESIRAVTRVRRHLPNTGEWAVANESLRLLSRVRDRVSDQVNRTVAAILHPMGKNQYALFERYNIIDNLKASIERGEPLRFGFKDAEAVNAEHARLAAMVDQVPEVKQALEARRAVVHDTVKKLVKHDMLPADAIANADSYYHQQVLSYMQAENAARIGNRKFGRASFQKKRLKGEADAFADERYDYNTSYVESEVKWLTDAAVKLEYAAALERLNRAYGKMDQLKQEAEASGTTWQSALKNHPDWAMWQPVPGNTMYPAFTIPDRIAEALQQGTIDYSSLSPDMISKIFAAGHPRKQYVFPKPLVDQLVEFTAPPPKEGPVGKLATDAMSAWKGWVTTISPKRVASYMLRNVTGDLDAFIAGVPKASRFIPRATKELIAYTTGQKLFTQPELETARRLGVISSGMSAVEIPDIKNVPVLRRLTGERTGPIRKWLGGVKQANEIREGTLRLAAYYQYLSDIRKNGRPGSYGGSNKATVDALIKEMGPEAAAAHLSRNLLGDYDNITVFGNWLRRKLIPFWSWNEINMKRYPKIVANAFEAGGAKGGLRAGGIVAVGAAAKTALLLSRIGALYAAVWTYNHLMHPKEEQELNEADRTSPHIILGRTPDDSIMLFRNVGALGDLAEWFGLNELIANVPKVRAGQMTPTEALKLMAKEPLNKLIGSIRPDIKAPMEVAAGVSTYPDVTRPRSVQRDNQVFQILGLEDEYRKVKGLVTGSGETNRPNYLARFLGVTDPKKNALYELYDLREQFLKSKGRDVPDFNGGGSSDPFKNMREAIAANDLGSFKKAMDAYIASGKTYANFKKSLSNLDPIASSLNRKDEAEFEQKFLTPDQRERLGAVRRYARDLEVQMWRQWRKAEVEAPESHQRTSALEAIDRDIASHVASLARAMPIKKSERESWQMDRSKGAEWLRSRGISQAEATRAYMKLIGSKWTIDPETGERKANSHYIADPSRRLRAITRARSVLSQVK